MKGRKHKKRLKQTCENKAEIVLELTNKGNTEWKATKTKEKNLNMWVEKKVIEKD